ncbi:MAG: hypothetical protein KGM98_01170 [Bacteroidota bacterium]|nr:hypothetical protein [Bacteroidota bacterium]
MRIILSFLFVVNSSILFAQGDLLSLVDNQPSQKQYITAAFKSTRVINGQSMEFLGKGVLDVRILHRFGLLSSGANNLYGLDQANMRLGFDYGVSNRLMVGVGRSNIGKELDGFIKYRPIWQSKGGRWSSPVSVVLISGTTLSTMPWSDPTRKNYFSSRMAFYNEIIIGRKFSDAFSLQVTPMMVHRNLVPLATDSNDTYALGIGMRLKISKRVAFVVDYHHILSGLDMHTYKDPLSVGIDIETGGHVFQLHFSNTTGLNEVQYITGTTNSWLKGQIGFGFNLSRVFTTGGKKRMSQ